MPKCHYCSKEIDTNHRESMSNAVYFREFMPDHLKSNDEYWYHERCLIAVMLQRAVKYI